MPLLDYSFKKHRVSLLETAQSGTSWGAWAVLARRRFLSLLTCWCDTRDTSLYSPHLASPVDNSFPLQMQDLFSWMFEGTGLSNRYLVTATGQWKALCNLYNKRGLISRVCVGWVWNTTVQMYVLYFPSGSPIFEGCAQGKVLQGYLDF